MSLPWFQVFEIFGIEVEHVLPFVAEIYSNWQWSVGIVIVEGNWSVLGANYLVGERPVLWDFLIGFSRMLI